MAAYRRVYDSRHLQADCQEPGSAPEPYARQSSIRYRYLFTSAKSPQAKKRLNEAMTEKGLELLKCIHWISNRTSSKP